MSHSNNLRLLQYLISNTLLILLVASCTNKGVIKPDSTKTPQVDVSESNDFSAQYYLSQVDSREPLQASPLLIQAAQQFYQKQDYVKSLWLAEQTLPIVNNNIEEAELLLIQASSLSALSKFDLALSSLNKVENISSLTKRLQLNYYQLIANIQQQRGLKLIATDALLRAFSLQDSNDEQHVKHLWLQLNELSQWQIDQLVILNPPYMKGWQQLLNFSHRFGYQKDSLGRYLTQWQRKFPKHPAQLLIDELTSTEQFVANEFHNIAVILPLSGPQINAGEAAQQGILAGYNNNDKKTLHFIDSNQLDFSQLSVMLAELQIDYVIGPLLKPNVDNYITQDNIAQPTLLLNLPAKQQIKPQHIVLSMDPKDEAIQAATTLSRQNFKHPIVFSQQDNVSKRITNNFVSQWNKITGVQPQVVFFDSESKMQEQLKDSLEISLSKQRIRDIDVRIRQKLKTETRSRRDLDMIYIVGSPNETRLLKPYIDVNISPFAQAIPIFASSRSHNDNGDSSDRRDLTGLHFTEMPWLLDSKQQNKPLKELNKSIWPSRSNSLQRIFAMGYDSLSLVDKFQMIKQTPYIRHYGQTGILKLDDQGVLTRSLLWGSYQKDKVAEIAME